ncbi:hypothetical protein KC967_00450 [Candidatus Saccharibacteria bacterium]|nr:hypothetical protein [Candidatus Saccharibacteria bacterium]
MAATNLTKEERRNATTSWSGYLYQGKVGILVALKSIASQAPGANLDDLRLEYEHHEDFCLVNGEMILSMHQVKAKAGADNHRMSTYSAAIKDFDGAQSPEDQRFLHVLVDIPDWSMESDKNPNNVQLFEYRDNNKFCSLLDDSVRQECIKYIQVIQPGRSDSEADVIYSSLLAMLTDKVGSCHAKNDRSHPVIAFREIIDCVRDSVIDEIKFEAEVVKLRELMLRTLNEADQDFEIAKLDKGLNWDQAINVVEGLCQLGDQELLIALSKLHPDDSTFFDSKHLKSDGFKNVFIEILRNIADFDLFNNGYIKNGENYFLTNISDIARNAPGVARRILENTNNSKLHFEGKHIVTRELEGRFSDFVGATKASESRNILQPENMKFMKVDTALHNLAQEEV